MKCAFRKIVIILNKVSLSIIKDTNSYQSPVPLEGPGSKAQGISDLVINLVDVSQNYNKRHYHLKLLLSKIMRSSHFFYQTFCGGLNSGETFLKSKLLVCIQRNPTSTNKQTNNRKELIHGLYMLCQQIKKQHGFLKQMGHTALCCSHRMLWGFFFMYFVVEQIVTLEQELNIKFFNFLLYLLSSCTKVTTGRLEGYTLVTLLRLLTLSATDVYLAVFVVFPTSL